VSCALVTTAAWATLGPSVAPVGAAGSKVRADFNGDGFSDMAVGAPSEGIQGFAVAGAVNVIYGSPRGLVSARNQLWTQASPGVPTNPQTGGRFGAALAAGDFNGDGFTDLAIGADGEDVGSVSAAGVVIVLYGTAAGLTSSGSDLFDQDSELMLDQAEPFDAFGQSLGAGNFGRTPEDDLAIGVGEGIGGAQAAGAVQVVYGSVSGLSQNGNQLWSEATPGVNGDGAETGDAFGYSGGGLAAADFGKDGHADLAIPIPSEDLGAIQDAGAVIVLYGGAGGLTAAGSQFWKQGANGLRDTAEANDRFGSSVAAGNFGKSSKADLAIGAPGEMVGSKSGCGAVSVLYGSSAGLTATANQFLTQDTTGIKDQCEGPSPVTGSGDGFGWSLASANFGRSGQADLAIGVAQEDIGAAVDAGAVQILYGSTSGVTTTGNQFWSQNSTGVADSSETASGHDVPETFGYSLLAANFGKAGQADLAIGVEGEDLVSNTVVDAGAVNVLYGSTNGITAAGNQLWTQDSTNIKDQAEANDEFGYAFASGPGASSR
jgi:FG-GAP repeat